MESTHDMESVNWLEEIGENEFGAEVAGWCSTNTFSLSDYYGNQGWFCTITRECMTFC